MANIPEISIVPPQIFEIGGLAVNNAIFSSFIVTLLLLGLVLVVYKKMTLIPGKLQLICEDLVGFFYERLLEAHGDVKKAKKHTALIVALFVFIFIANYFTLIPLVQSLVLDGSTFIFTAPTSHFALTISLALIVSGVSHYIAFTTAPIRHLGNFIRIREFLKIRRFKDVPNACLEFFLGLLDIVGEVAKILSLSARLFGNIFAGQVMAVVIAGLSFYTQFLVPIPFFALGMLSGLIQAMVFAILAMAFISIVANSVKEMNT